MVQYLLRLGQKDNLFEFLLRPNLTANFFVSFFRFFDKKFETLTIEYPLCSGENIDICKVSFADWVVNDVSLNGYFITFWW